MFDLDCQLIFFSSDLPTDPLGPFSPGGPMSPGCPGSPAKVHNNHIYHDQSIKYTIPFNSGLPTGSTTRPFLSLITLLWETIQLLCGNIF